MSQNSATRKRGITYGLPAATVFCLVCLLRPAVATATDQDDDEERDSRVQVQVESPKPIELREYRRGSDDGQPFSIPAAKGPGGGWQVILWHRSRLVVSGPGVSSREFQLEWSAPTHLSIQPGPRGRERAGLALWLSGLGLVALGMGTGLLSWSYQSQSRAVGPPGWFSSQDQLAITAGVSVSVGALAAVVGGSLHGTSRTRIVQRSLF